MAIPGAKLLLAAIYKGKKIMNITKSTKISAYDKVWLNNNIKAVYHKT